MKRSLCIMCLMLSAVLSVTGCGSSSGNTPASQSSKQLLSFSIVSPVSEGAVDELKKTVAVTVPYGTDVTALKVNYATNGSTTTVNGVEQITGVTANNFSSPVTYIVTALDGSVSAYVVKVTLGISSDKDITSFKINGVSGTITGTDISVVLPYGTALNELYAQVSITGASLAIGTTAANGMTSVDFTGPVEYTVTAFDTTTKKYTVTVTTMAAEVKEFTSFSIMGYKGTITGTAISVVLPYGSSLTPLYPVFTVNGKSVTVGTIVQTSGNTSNDFTSPVTYTVTSCDGLSTVDYTVKVTIANNVMLSFSLDTSSGKIDGTNIAVTLPHGAMLEEASAWFTVPDGTVVTVGGAAQLSGSKGNFTAPVVYVVTAADGSTASYTVTAAIAPSFYIAGKNGNFAVYWKDGVEIKLTDGVSAAVAHRILVSGTDLYIAGSNGDYAVYWKVSADKIDEVKLTDGTAEAVASSIALSGSTVYCGGYDGDSAVLWKDGKKITLSVYGIVYSLVIANGDIYACGASGDYAAVWKNGDETLLGLGEATSMTISGTDLYVAGVTVSAVSMFDSAAMKIKSFVSRSSASKTKVSKRSASSAVWKNGVLMDIESLAYTFLYTVAVSGSDVYTGGDSKMYSDGFWKNGIADSGYIDATVYEIVISGNDIVSVGDYDGYAAYWVNGSRILLSTESSVRAYGIAAASN